MNFDINIKINCIPCRTVLSLIKRSKRFLNLINIIVKTLRKSGNADDASFKESHKTLLNCSFYYVTINRDRAPSFNLETLKREKVAERP